MGDSISCNLTQENHKRPLSFSECKRVMEWNMITYFSQNIAHPNNNNTILQ